ncbi:MAG TPA: hypothetical protein VMP01_29855 [Pirellulaceae bacterium]|nr:hypothetical protein [Pirellulaceae bacterium]
MTDVTQHSLSGGAKQERFRFSLRQLLGIVFVIGLLLGTIRLVIASPAWTSLVGGIGFAVAALVFLVLVVNARATLAEFIVVGVIVALFAAWLLPAIHAAKEAPSATPVPSPADAAHKGAR